MYLDLARARDDPIASDICGFAVSSRILRTPREARVILSRVRYRGCSISPHRARIATPPVEPLSL